MRIGLVLNILDEEYQISIYSGIKKRAKELGVEIICFQEENVLFSSETFVAQFPKKNFFNLDGIILLTSVMADNFSINKRQDVENVWGKIPFISLGQKIEDVPSVIIKADSSMYELMEHLLNEHKYRHFLYISGTKNHLDANVRENIFTGCIEKYKKDFPEMSYYIKRGWFNQSAAIEALTEFYDEHPDVKIDAVVCANDNMAIGTYKFYKIYRDNNIFVPSAVTGFDDIPQAKFVIPPLTTIHQPIDVMGVKALDTIFDMLNGKEVQKESFVEAKFILRNSCGCDQSKTGWRNANFVEDIQANYVQSEQMLRMVSHIGQDLNYGETESGLKYIVNVNMEQMDIKNFCILSFPNYFENFIEASQILKVKPMYVRRNGKFFYEFCENKEMSLGDFYNKYLDFDNERPNSLVFKFLYTGNEIVGCVLYDATEAVLPYLCSMSINFAQSITRIRSLEEKKRRSEYLEAEVAKRTAELVEANNKRMEVEAEVLKISELERQRFSNDLHDDICQRLAGISMLCRSYSNQEEPVEKKQMSELAEMIKDTLQTTRQYAHNSYPVELESLGINKSIGNLCNTFEKQSGTRCNYIWNISEDIEFDKTQKLNIFRIIQEALHNIMKHAKAKNVEVSVISEGKNVEVKICDDGCGIAEKSETQSKGLGLNSMVYRANQIGATFDIYQNQPAGTCIELKLTT